MIAKTPAQTFKRIILEAFYISLNLLTSGSNLPAYFHYKRYFLFFIFFFHFVDIYYMDCLGI